MTKRGYLKLRYYEMDDRYHWWIHILVTRKSNRQDCRIRWKMLNNHDSLYSLDKMEN